MLDAEAGFGCITRMKVKIPAFLLLFVAALVLSGCMSTVDGGKRAGVGVMMKDTIEEKIVTLHRQKRELAEGLLSGGDAGTRLSIDEWMKMLKEDN